MVNFAERPAHVLPVPMWVLAIHAVQVVFAIVILGLDAYGIHWIAYNALIYSLVVCICTLGVCAYLLASQLFLHSLYNMYIALAFHMWMLLFWVIDLGLVANLARLWSGDYVYGYSWSYYYTSYYKRDLAKRDETTYEAYYGALAAGAVFAAVQFVTWIACTVILLITWNKNRHNAANNNTHTSQPPPQYPNNGQAVPMEKYGQTNVQTQPQQQTPQPQYAQPVQQQQYVQQPPQQQNPYMQQQQQYPQQPQQQYPQQQQQQFGAPYPQDPVPRQDTVSPVSSAAYGYAAPSNVSELNTPQHTGASYPSGASELGGVQPQQKQQAGAYDPNMPELSDRK